MIFIDEVEINVGVMSALFWTIDMARVGVEIEAKVGSGTATLGVEHDKGDGTISIEANTDMLPLASLPGVSESVGLPMAGGLNADLAVDLPKGDWSKVSGFIKLNCVGCTVGDGVAKLKMKPRKGAKRRSRRALVFAGEGLTVPKLNLGAALAEVDIKDGIGAIKTLGATSKDGFLKIEGKIEFKKPFSESTFPGCMTFGLSDELKKREANFGNIGTLLPEKARQEDGSYAIPTRGKLTSLGWDVRHKCGEEPAPAKKRNRSRPKISSKPPEKKEPGERSPRDVDTVPRSIRPEGKGDVKPTPGGPTLTKDKDKAEKSAEGDEAAKEKDSDENEEETDEEGGSEEEEGDSEEAAEEGDGEGDESEEEGEGHAVD
jgi:type II secretion system protein N